MSVHRGPDTKLSVWSVAYVFTSIHKYRPTKRLPGFLTGWRNGSPRNSNLLKILFVVKTTNFDPNEQYAKGKLIGNQASQKLGFGNSDDPVDEVAG